MQITIDLIKHIAHLAHIHISDNEVIKFKKELESIVDYFENLNEIDTSKIKPTSQVTDIKNIFRNDTMINHPKLKYLNKDNNGYFKIFSPISTK